MKYKNYLFLAFLIIFFLPGFINSVHAQETQINPVVECDRLARLYMNDPCYLNMNRCGKTKKFIIDHEKAEPVCRKALQSYPDNPVIQYQLGRVLRAAGQYEETLKMFEQAVEQGHIWAMEDYASLAWELLRYYKDGFGTVGGKISVDIKDIPENVMNMTVKDTLEWRFKAAEMGHSYSQYALSNFYEAGSGDYDESVPIDLNKAQYWLKMAAEGDNPLAQYWLGLKYQHGTMGLEKDKAKAIKWFKRSAEQGNLSALHQFYFLNYWSYMFFGDNALE